MKLLRDQNWPDIVPNGSRIFVGSGVGTPLALVHSMLNNSGGFQDVELVHSFIAGPAPWIEPEYRDRIRTNTFYMNADLHQAVNEGAADYTPCRLSEIPRLFRSRQLPIRAALIEVSPPDAEGRCSLGTNIDIVHAAVQAAEVVVAQINPLMPRTHGNTHLSVSAIDYYVEQEEELPEIPQWDSTVVSRHIGQYVSELIDDGSTLQVGMGRLPQCVAASLSDHRHLGVHTGRFSNALMGLMKAGVIDNSRKTFKPGVVVADHCQGVKELYEFVNDNPEVELHPSEFVNAAEHIAGNDSMVSITTAIAMDLTGQIVRDSLGRVFYHGVGEQLDFLHGAAISNHGRPIVVLPSTTPDGSKSRIVARLKGGAGIGASRSDIHFVVTEYGIATLYGRSVRERSLELIQIAHPDFRERLLKKARKYRWVPAYVTTAGATLQVPNEGIETHRIRVGKDSWLMRPLHPTDVRRLQEFFYSHDAQTVHLRYGHLLKSLSQESAYLETNVDPNRDLSLAVFEEIADSTCIRAVASFFRDEDKKTAEISFVVDEALRRKGLSSMMLREMARLGRRRGIKTFWAQVLQINSPMICFFTKFGAAKQPVPDEDSLKFELDLDKIT